MISNHFWWFEISKHNCFVVTSFFCIQFVWSTLCFMGLDSFIGVSEIHFKSPKVPSWVVCNSRNSFFGIRFVVNGKCHVIVFWQGLYFVCVIPMGRGVFLVCFLFFYFCDFLLIFRVWKVELQKGLVVPKVWKTSSKTDEECL